MENVGINGFRAVARAAVVAVGVTVLSGVAWAQYSSGPSGSGPHTGQSSDTSSSQMVPSAAGQGADYCSPNAAAVGSRCAESSGSSGNAAPSSSGDAGGVLVNDLQTRPRNDKIPSRRTDD